MISEHPQFLVSEWLRRTGSPLDPPGHVRKAMRQLAREEQIESQHYIDYEIGELERIVEASRQFELALPQMDERARARGAVADYLERVVLPWSTDPAVRKLPKRLREARQSFSFGFNPSDGRTMIRWDNKAGLPLLCPDDAREEAMRLQERTVPALLDAVKNDMHLHYGVFTVPNAAPGTLRATMRKLMKRFAALLKMRHEKRLRFPQIKGALVVLEAPLGRYRDWHPHLNVILVCDGWLDYGALRRAWHWNVELKRLHGSREHVEAALRELIKYSTRAVPEKSYAKAAVSVGVGAQCVGTDSISDMALAASSDAAVSSPRSGARAVDACQPPALIEWTRDEFGEWWAAHKGFRRTRTYGVLYGLEKPEPEDFSGVKWIGSGSFDGTRFTFRSSLLESIPGDKSTTPDVLERAKRAYQRLYGSPTELAELRKAAFRPSASNPRWQNSVH